MKVLFRVDSSNEIGIGHIMRCISLADYLSLQDAEVAFVYRDLDGDITETLIKTEYHSTKFSIGSSSNDLQLLDAEQTINASRYLFPDGFDWLIVDHYDLDVKWERNFKQLKCKILVIDDLANREHDCDLLLDQNYYENMESRYHKLLPSNTQQLLGLRYLLLRKEFQLALNNQTKRDGTVKRIFMFFGGSDSSQETLKALDSLKEFNQKTILVDLVVGSANTESKKIQKICETMPNVNFHYNVNNIAEIMSRTDLAVIAAGSTTWEASYMALPIITIMTAQNQFETISTLSKNNVIWNLGWNYNVKSTDITKTLKLACESPKKLSELGRRAKQLTGNSSGVENVVTTMFSVNSK